MTPANLRRLETVYRENKQAAWYRVSRWFADGQLAYYTEDIVQDAFTNLAASNVVVPIDSDGQRAMLNVSLRWAWTVFWRKRFALKRADTQEVELSEYESPISIERIVEARLLLEKAIKAVYDLPPKQREALLKSINSDETPDRFNLHYARKNLRRMIDDTTRISSTG